MFIKVKVVILNLLICCEVGGCFNKSKARDSNLNGVKMVRHSFKLITSTIFSCLRFGNNLIESRDLYCNDKPYMSKNG